MNRRVYDYVLVQIVCGTNNTPCLALVAGDFFLWFCAELVSGVTLERKMSLITFMSLDSWQYCVLQLCLLLLLVVVLSQLLLIFFVCSVSVFAVFGIFQEAVQG